MAIKEVTAKDLVDALKKNGFKQVFGEFIVFDDDNIDAPLETRRVIGGCAYGQAAVNLGVDPDELSSMFEDYILSRYHDRYDNSINIINMNDSEHIPIPKIGKLVEEWLIDHGVDLNTVIGSTVIVEYRVD